MNFTTENGVTFSSDEVEALIATRSNIQLLNEYTRYFYRQYIHIRNCVNPKKCKRVLLGQVRERLADTSNMQLTCKLINLNEAQVLYIIGFCEQYVTAIQ